MPDEIKALAIALAAGDGYAKYVLERLEKQGYTVYRKKVAKNGRRPRVSNPVTPQLAAQIRAYFKTHPLATQQEIATHFNVNIGRISEVLGEGK